MVIKNKQDVIKWLKELRRSHPLSTAEALTVNHPHKHIKVYTDTIIRKRYNQMIVFLQSDEVQ